jgi:hypothetical protein
VGKLAPAAIIAAATFLLLGCRTDEDAPAKLVDSPAPAATATPTPSPTSTHVHSEPPPAGWVPSPTPTGLPHVPSGFDSSLGMQASWGSGAISKSAAPDVVGAFRMTCGASDIGYIDPIVYPGIAGQSHLHQFYGLRGVGISETYESARADHRVSSCGSEDYSLNKSAYWLPALLDGRGNVIQPNLVSIYYKRRPKTDSACDWNTDPRGQAEECVNMPQGLRVVAGFDMNDPVAAAKRKTPGVRFTCVKDNVGSPGSDSLESELKEPICAGDTKLTVVLDFPNCWDGKHLDSPDHRSHLAYGSYGSWGYLKCPATHPKLIPELHIAAEYSLEAGDDRSLIRLSSDVFDGIPRGRSLHGDALFAWDPVAWQMFHDNCIDKLLNCSGGDLGNGLQLKGASKPSYGWTNPNRLVPVPPRS